MGRKRVSSLATPAAPGLAGLLILLAVLGPLFSGVASGQSCPTGEVPPPEYTWQGESKAVRVAFPSRREGEVLCGTLFAPADGAYADDPSTVGLDESRRPAIVAIPGGGGEESTRYPDARHLAGHGYVVLTVEPGGGGTERLVTSEPCMPDGEKGGELGIRCEGFEEGLTPHFTEAVFAGIDFLVSPGQPFADETDSERIGGIGFSGGATAVTIAQETDDRLDAVVALDNVRSTRWGDDGTATCTSPYRAFRLVADIEVTPRVPAFGHASEGSCNTDDPDAKKRGYHRWRDAGLPTMEVVHEGTGHSDFNSSNGALRHRIAHYSLAWFDRYLLGEPSLAALFVEEIDGVSREEYLADAFRSAVFLPEEEIDCEDLLECETGGIPTPTPAPEPTPTPGPVDGPACDGLAATIVGTEGDDVINAGAGDDVIVSLGGNDVVRGNDGNDVICAGEGNDVVYGGAGNDRIFGESGDDLLLGGSGEGDVAVGGDGVDVCDTETADGSCEVRRP